jgi:hypothetical protein
LGGLGCSREEVIMKKVLAFLSVLFLSVLCYAQTDSIDINGGFNIQPPKPADTIVSHETYRQLFTIAKNKTFKAVLKGTGVDTTHILTLKAVPLPINGTGKVLSYDSMDVFIKIEVHRYYGKKIQ